MIPLNPNNNDEWHHHHQLQHQRQELKIGGRVRGADKIGNDNGKYSKQEY